MDSKPENANEYENSIFEQLKNRRYEMSKKDFDKLIEEKIRESDPLKSKQFYQEKWQLHYAKERIKKNIFDFNKQKIKENKKINFDFLFTGRMGRLHYFLSLACLAIVFSVVISFINVTFQKNWSLLEGGAAIIMYLFRIPFELKRLHDLNLGAWVLIYFVIIQFFDRPEVVFIVILIYSLFLLFKKGDSKDNKYGKVIPVGTKYWDVLFDRYDNNKN